MIRFGMRFCIISGVRIWAQRGFLSISDYSVVAICSAEVARKTRPSSVPAVVFGVATNTPRWALLLDGLKRRVTESISVAPALSKFNGISIRIAVQPSRIAVQPSDVADVPQHLD